jgi:hypothetical protein
MKAFTLSSVPSYENTAAPANSASQKATSALFLEWVVDGEAEPVAWIPTVKGGNLLGVTYAASCWLFAPLGAYIVVYHEAIHGAVESIYVPWWLLGSILLVVSPPLSFMADYITFGRSSAWKVADKFLASWLVAYFAFLFVKALASQPSCKTERAGDASDRLPLSVTILFTGVLLAALICKYQSFALLRSRRDADGVAYAGWHSAWHFISALGGLLICRMLALHFIALRCPPPIHFTALLHWIMKRASGMEQRYCGLKVVGLWLVVCCLCAGLRLSDPSS